MVKVVIKRNVCEWEYSLDDKVRLETRPFGDNSVKFKVITYYETKKVPVLKSVEVIFEGEGFEYEPSEEILINQKSYTVDRVIRSVEGLHEVWLKDRIEEPERLEEILSELKEERRIRKEIYLEREEEEREYARSQMLNHEKLRRAKYVQEEREREREREIENKKADERAKRESLIETIRVSTLGTAAIITLIGIYYIIVKGL